MFQKRIEFPIRGVSFYLNEYGEQNLKACQAGEAVMLVQEYSNPFDINAVAVKRLDGTMLGYVPRERNQGPELKRQESFARIKGMGLAQGTNLYGAQVYYNPGPEPLIALAPPTEISPIVEDIYEYMSFADRQSVKDLVEERDGVSGFGTYQLTLSPVWRVDDVHRELTLLDFKFISSEKKSAQDQFLDEVITDKDSRKVSAVFERVNGWTTTEAETYKAYKQSVIDERNEQPSWKVDLSLLVGWGIPIDSILSQMPEELQVYVKKEDVLNILN